MSQRGLDAFQLLGSRLSARRTTARDVSAPEHRASHVLTSRERRYSIPVISPLGKDLTDNEPGQSTVLPVAFSVSDTTY